ncbi:5-oxoprolinase subunit PxpA [Microbacterium sp. A1-JK]|uniref:5-oxoprolinase subunit PxpA n=1 Tax=Microbacterium sp. A1-JK TaxID=3177516 RepID=UPI00388B6166
MGTIDLNADLGETIRGVATADDEAMFALISSANIACGGHAGDAASMRASVTRAERFGVAVGAHPSYVDPENFGRVRRDPGAVALRAQIAAQLDALRAAGAEIRYVKPHGALYHAVVDDAGQADALVDAVADLASDLGRPVALLGVGGEVERAAVAAGLPFRREAFLDRGYLSTGALVPRGEPGDLLDDPEAVAARARRLVADGELDAVDGTRLRPNADSLCVHGDTPASVAMARAVRRGLAADGVSVRAPW